jgi:hypothetical protein
MMARTTTSTTTSTMGLLVTSLVMMMTMMMMTSTRTVVPVAGFDSSRVIRSRAAWTNCNTMPMMHQHQHTSAAFACRRLSLGLALGASPSGDGSSMNSVSDVVTDTDTDTDDAVDTSSMDMDSIDTSVPISPVLKQVYPDLLQHVQEYGHPNIPLGSTAGRKCETLRRLHIQQKLSDTDVTLLEHLQFRFHSLEDVYATADFDELYARLVAYQTVTGGDVSPPKKYALDPELGAWVTGIRRVYNSKNEHDKDVANGDVNRVPNNMNATHVQALNNIGFQWSSPRQCGSSFMQQYRQILQDVETAVGESESGNYESAAVAATDIVLSDPQIQQWIQAQREAAKKGSLSETRLHYLATLVGVDWLSQES